MMYYYYCLEKYWMFVFIISSNSSSSIIMDVIIIIISIVAHLKRCYTICAALVRFHFVNSIKITIVLCTHKYDSASQLRRTKQPNNYNVTPIGKK